MSLMGGVGSDIVCSSYYFMASACDAMFVPSYLLPCVCVFAVLSGLMITSLGGEGTAVSSVM